MSQSYGDMNPEYGNMEKSCVLVADNGATKCSWASIGSDGRVERFGTDGVNPAVSSPAAPASAARAASDRFAALNLPYRPVEIWFYTAGAASDSLTLPLKLAFGRMFPDAEVNVLSDMLGAARAVCGAEAGIVGILGTGSNSCLYDGRNIVESGFGGGYVLGDEGSGAWFGKTLLSDFIRNRLPEDMAEALREKYSLDYQTIVENVYRSDSPSRYLASFFPFLLRWAGMGTDGELPGEHSGEYPGEHFLESAPEESVPAESREYAGLLLREGFCAFLDRCVTGRYDFRRYPLHLCGSVAWLCRDIIAGCAASRGIALGGIVKSPIDGLVEYHSNDRRR